MSIKTGIEWTDSTWNPIRGCTRVSEGCRHCYAEVVAARFSGPGQAYEGLARRTSTGEARWTGKIMFVEKHLLDPLRWREPRKIFVNSMSDLFHEGVPDEELDRIFAVMALAHHHTFQVLTKRPERMRAYLSSSSWPRNIGAAADAIMDGLRGSAKSIAIDATAHHFLWFENPDLNDDRTYRFKLKDEPLRNVWLGTSVENQETADERIPILLDTPSAVRFLSCEPLLGPIEFPLPCAGSRFWTDLHWVIVGGESGAKARPCDVSWIRSIVAQCAQAKVPCFVKQMGKWITGNHQGDGAAGFDTGFVVNRWLFPDGSVFVPPIIGARAHERPGSAIAFGNCDTHGGNWNEWPRDLRVREFPAEVAA
jgi:protein gp37